MKISKLGKVAIIGIGAIALILLVRKVAKGQGTKVSGLGGSATGGASSGGSTITNTVFSGDKFPLKTGSKGGNVTVLQKKLNSKADSEKEGLFGQVNPNWVNKVSNAGLSQSDFPLSEDGVFGSTTEKALKMFTGKTSIDETGLAKL